MKPSSGANPTKPWSEKQIPVNGLLASLLGLPSRRGRLARKAVETEALRHSNAMKTALLRAVSHDFRSPLTAIVVSAGALAHGELSLEHGDRRDLTQTILSEARRLDRMVSNLLDVSRFESNISEPEAELWAIDDLVLRALDGINAATPRIEVVFPQSESPVVLVDIHQAERVLANLLENALRYSTPPQKVRVQVIETSSDVFIRVIDHGPGIPRDDLERIFKPFERGSRTAEVQGAGLGLAIARGFAEANGGRVWAESLEGQGATLVFALPRAIIDASRSHEAPAQTRDVPLSTAKRALRSARLRRTLVSRTSTTAQHDARATQVQRRHHPNAYQCSTRAGASPLQANPFVSAHRCSR